MSEHNSNSEKKFIGRSEKKTTSLGEMRKLGLHRSDLEYLLSQLNERGWIDLIIKDRSDGTVFTQVDKFHKPANKS